MGTDNAANRAPDHEPDRPQLEPVAPDGSGRARAVVALLAIAAFIGLAVVEPWAGQPASTPIARAPTAQPPPSTRVQPSPAQPSPTTTGDRSPPRRSTDWHRQFPRARAGDQGWGVRALVAVGSAERETPGHSVRPTIREIWRALPATTWGARLRLGTEGHRVVALGVTSPREQPPLDVRVWRVWQERHHYVAAEHVALPGQAVQTVLLPPADGAGERTWPPGRYRIDVLTGRAIMRIDVELPGNPVAVLRVPRSGPVAANEDLAATLGGVRPGVHGLFLERAGPPHIACLDAETGPALEEAAAWLDLEGPASAAACPGPQATDTPHAFALLLGEGERLRRASLHRLEPVAESLGTASLLDTPPREGGTAGTRRLALFRASEAGRWQPGSYRIDAEWRDGQGRHSGSWLLQLYPGSSGPRPLLDAARRATILAGRWSIVGGLLDPPRDQPPDSVPADTAALGRTCQGAKIMSTDTAVIVGYEGDPPATASVMRIFGDGVALPLPAYVVDAVPGTLVFAPAGDTVWRPGYYRIRLLYLASQPDEQNLARDLVFCVGLYEPNGDLRVPLGVDETP